jgi:hypothetical protein
MESGVHAGGPVPGDTVSRVLEPTRAMRGPDFFLAPDPVIELYKQGVDRTLLRQNLRRSVEERILNLIELQRFAEELRRAGERSREQRR